MRSADAKAGYTTQLISKLTPDEGAVHLSLFMVCRRCHTTRGFRIGKYIEDLKSGNSHAIKFVTFCEKCGEQHEVTLAMTDREHGWKEHDPMNPDEPCTFVQDGMGMR